MSEKPQTTENHAPVARSTRWASIGIVISAIGALILFLALAIAYFILSRTMMNVATMAAESKMQIANAEHQMTVMQQSLTGLQQDMQKAQSLALQQSQALTALQGGPQSDVSRQVAEAKYLVILANQHAQFAWDRNTVLLLIQQADNALQNVTDAKSLALRKALANDMTNLQATPPLDITAEYLRLSELSHRLAALPLTEGLKSTAPPSKPGPASASASAGDLPWWKAGTDHLGRVLSEIVIVRKTGPLPVVLPEDKDYLYQHLQAQLDHATWGLLHHQAEVYQKGLAELALTIERYFDVTAPATQSVLATIAELQKINVQPPAVNLAPTLQLFNDYFGGPR